MHTLGLRVCMRALYGYMYVFIYVRAYVRSLQPYTHTHIIHTYIEVGCVIICSPYSLASVYNIYRIITVYIQKFQNNSDCIFHFRIALIAKGHWTNLFTFYSPYFYATWDQFPFCAVSRPTSLPNKGVWHCSMCLNDPPSLSILITSASSAALLLRYSSYTLM